MLNIRIFGVLLVVAYTASIVCDKLRKLSKKLLEFVSYKFMLLQLIQFKNAIKETLNAYQLLAIKSCTIKPTVRNNNRKISLFTKILFLADFKILSIDPFHIPILRLKPDLTRPVNIDLNITNIEMFGLHDFNIYKIR